MSDRCVFIPCLGRNSDPGIYGWADILVFEKASADDIHLAADQFCRLSGPRKIMIDSREDPRFIEFCHYLNDKYGMCEEGDWGFSVIEASCAK